MTDPIVARVPLPPHLRPAHYWPRGGLPIVLVHDDLPIHEERSAVAHEIAHHERGGGIDRAGMPATWRPVVARDEAATDRDAAHKLLPPDELSAWVDERLVDVEVGIGPVDVAAEFNITLRLAEAALDNLTDWERTIGRQSDPPPQL